LMGRRDSGSIAKGLRRHPILAIAAMEIAAKHSETHRQRSGKGMEERLFLYRIELQGSDIAMRYEKFAAAIESNPANAVQAIKNDASVAARKAPQLPTFKLLVKLALPRKALQNIL
jgi:hypothetical protein